MLDIKRMRSLYFLFLVVPHFGNHFVLSRYILLQLQDEKAIEPSMDVDGNDLAEGGSCKCSCTGNCEPKGCAGIAGQTVTGRSLGTIFYKLDYA